MDNTLAVVFREQIKKAISLSKVPGVVTEHNVFQEGDADILPILDEMVESQTLSGTGLDGLENLEELLAKAESGKSCLLLLEHYSNFDLSIFSLLVRRAKGRGDDIANALIAIAGMKLNEDNPVVAAFASAYTRIVIYPSRSLHGLPAEKKQVELPRSFAINRAAMKALDEAKTQGRLILVFPSGTRYRPWDPKTKQGVREIDTYIKSFDYMCPIAINGEVLHVRQGDMMEDSVSKDIVRITAGKVISCSEFRDKVRAGVDAKVDQGEPADKKQAVADAIMDLLEEMHIQGEEKRKLLLEK